MIRTNGEVYFLNLYFIRLRGNDSLVAAGTAKECAAAMGMTMNCFYSTVSHTKSGKIKKYEIDVEPLREGNEDE
jgi:hypothetical protein